MTGPSPDEAAALGLIEELFPITRSITGAGVRQTLGIIGRRIPITITEVASGTAVLDWVVPPEWNIRSAYIANERGDRVIDMQDCNLHVMSYSVPVDATMSLAELRPHLYTLPDHPDWIPYRTSYYAEAWGFCLTQAQLKVLPDETYHVRIDSSLTEGSLTYGECLLPGDTEEEVLFSAHVCHPSLANDNLSAVALATMLAAELSQRPHRYTYRFLFAPGTIGAICWLAGHEAEVGRIRHGLTLAGLGIGDGITYKRSRRGSAPIDAVAEHVLASRPSGSKVIDFTPYGYDERQFGSPGFDLPVGSLTRTPNGEYPEYHTSADNLAFLSAGAIADSLATLRAIVGLLEQNRTYVNLAPRGEPQLGRRGLYPSTGGGDMQSRQMAMLWVLNQSDGQHSLLDIARRSGLTVAELAAAADQLQAGGLLEAHD